MQKIDTRTKCLFCRIARVVAPPPKLTISEWADLYRRLSSEASAEPGQWRTDRAPYQREIMDALNDDEVETIVVMSSAQVGKTELILNVIGYYVHQDPSPIMLVQPTLELAQAFSKDRLSPMTRDSPELKKRMTSAKSRDGGNTMLHKSFPGGHITMAGANSPASLASRPIRIVLLDEVDRYPVSAGTEGDPVTLVSKRSTTFLNRKRVLVSTPTIKGASRIETAYEESTMEQWCLPCPSCSDHQPLDWKQIRFDDASMVCKHCGAIHSELEWKASTGRWIARKENSKVRGFHLNELASPWKRWSTIIEEFREAKRGGPETLKAWVNTSLGETWEEKGEQLDEDILLKRREMYHADVPDGVKILTAAVDTQDNRFEIDVMGWGAGHESWRIQYRVIYGDLKQPQVWTDLDEFLQRTWTDAEGRKFRIAITCMDSGGHFTNEVYRFCKERHARRVFAIKGESPGDGTYLPLIAGTSTNNRYKATVVRLGVNEGKSKVMSALSLSPTDEAGNKVQGYCHFPLTTPDKNRGYDRQYFEGLTAEALQTRYKMGSPYQVWVKVRTRNEPLDLAVYNRAAIEILQPNLDLPLPPMREEPAATATPPQTRQRRRGTTSSV
ncbi:phage terminase large subunit family protein [Paenibacillus harenae]|uniref:Phage terminase large subunit GpA-like protein n=1 Tax=Paenibacillus harenae TaxID=306543 RepID=A0ABT9U824_PAEHA|nr:phage terminase large subunit family protein [Paenibacillus harenae]MDQ0114369.1 phage terminase large subunit GpA-like protein [Paenibacillus harenae]